MNQDFYGGYQWIERQEDLQDWFCMMGTLTKEPAYTSYTNLKLTNDFIFYQGEGLNVIRTLDVPSFNFVMDKFQTLPHPFMPSDHLCIVADFIFL